MARREPKRPDPNVPWWADPDPWRLSPAQEQAAAEARAKSAAEAAATPDEPPF